MAKLCLIEVIFFGLGKFRAEVWKESLMRLYSILEVSCR